MWAHASTDWSKSRYRGQGILHEMPEIFLRVSGVLQADAGPGQHASAQICAPLAANSASCRWRGSSTFVSSAGGVSLGVGCTKEFMHIYQEGGVS